ncbi:hypothetical protein DAPPUDRAFT_209751 [Daphnia pulex]|uniref:phosphoinositide 5-phosphatase n=1 Tax=Daphnia pulex TaxID=6669 RepID=E9G8P5_DAPPU|nr:hypothetical protein DAPPUDRAFT_209751 [Daphnia pulex]|eukprot:EFX84231.1 hypothetical protein DAPPUDRAFT_209751 [Daphnia pulex]
MLPSFKANKFSGSDSEPLTSTAAETDSSNNCHDAIPAHLNQKADSELSSPDVTAHRSSIATGGATPIAARESVVRYQMALRETAYTDLRQITIFLGTYNVNGQPPTSGLADWLSIDKDPPDIYAVGFQELDLSKEAFLFNETPREEEWYRAVFRGLHPKGKYRKVKLVRLVGMMLIVFIQEKHWAYVRSVASEVVGTGLMGKMGNKGGVAIRFDLHNSSICFVNSHLAAHTEEVERRNQDYLDICNRLVFSTTFPSKSIKDHDQVFWIGDLNYRLSGDLDLLRVKELLDQNNHQALLQYDQFRAQHAAHKIFIGYQEGPIQFRPSYKYDPGTDNWDTSEKNRAPAWCDRCLWKGDNVQVKDYRSHPGLRMSDHKPVSCFLECGVKIIDTVRYRKIYEEVMKKLDKLENEFLPQVSVDSTEINFGKVSFNEGATKVLTVANTGQVPVQYEFIKKHRDSNYCKPWLACEPYTGFLMPGDNSYITLEVLVDKRTAWSLNSGLDELYDILVLHLDGGKDIFITVSGQYQKSCFGCSIEALIQMHQPISQVPPETVCQYEKAAYPSVDPGNDSDSKQPVLAVPKELWFILDELYRRGMDTPGLFEQPGLSSEIAAIRRTLDDSLPDTLPGSVHSVAESLLIFLETLKEPIIPFGLTQKALDGCTAFASCKMVYTSLPLSHQHVFKHIISFLKEVLLHSNKNGLDAKTLVALFGSAMIRLPPPKYPLGSSISLSQNQPHLDRKRTTFIHHFLVNDLDD